MLACSIRRLLLFGLIAMNFGGGGGGAVAQQPRLSGYNVDELAGAQLGCNQREKLDIDNNNNININISGNKLC